MARRVMPMKLPANDPSKPRLTSRERMTAKRARAEAEPTKDIRHYKKQTMIDNLPPLRSDPNIPFISERNGGPGNDP